MDKLRLPDSDFALTTDALDFMQNSYNYLEKIGFIGGTNYILSGGDVTGGSAAAGIVVLNGEVMPFTGGAIQTNVRVITVNSDITVGVAQRREITKYAEFGTSANPAENFPWADLDKIDTILELMGRMEALESFTDSLADTEWVSLTAPAGTNITWAMARRHGKNVTITGKFEITDNTILGSPILVLPATIPGPITPDDNGVYLVICRSHIAQEPIAGVINQNGEISANRNQFVELIDYEFSVSYII